MKLRIKNIFYSFVLAGALLLPTSSSEQTTYRLPTAENKSLKVLAWNLQRFGPKKSQDTQLMKEYSGILTNYDLVFLQEITDSTKTAVDELKRHMPNYISKISNRAGKSNQKEQYLVFLRNSKNFTIKDFKDFSPDKQNRWERPPVYLEVQSEKYSVKFFCIHTRPADAIREISYLEKICTNLGNLVVLGDLNLSKADRNREHFFSTWKYLIEDKEDTTIGLSESAPDRIIVNRDAFREVIRAGVVRKKSDITISSKLSDHYPLELEILLNEM